MVWCSETELLIPEVNVSAATGDSSAISGARVETGVDVHQDTRAGTATSFE